MSDPCREAFEKQIKSFKHFQMTQDEKDLRWSWWKLSWNACSITSVSQESNIPTRLEITIDEASSILDEFQKCGCNNPTHLKDLMNIFIQAQTIIDQETKGPL